MCRSDDSEVSAVKRCDLGDPEPLAGCDHRSVHRAERKILVHRDQLRDAEPVAGEHRLDQQVATGEVTEEADLSLGAEAGLEQVDDLGDDECGDEQRAGVLLEDAEARGVVPVIGVDVGVERTGVDEDSYRATSARRISSIRSEMSEWPLWPTPAAIR